MPTEAFSALKEPPKILDKQTAWGCFTSNMLALPGHGSLTAGFRKAGVFQILIVLLGDIQMIAWLMRRTYEWTLERGAFFQWGSWRWLLFTGFSLRCIAWIWSFITSMKILRMASPQKSPPQID